MKKILIISFTYPPQYGIGGRRWAKFSKYMRREGLDLTVYTTPPELSNSPWTGDVFDINIKEIPSGYPAIIRFGVTSFIDKVYYRYQLMRLRFLVKGNYYDHSSLWTKPLLRSLKNEDLNNCVIVASGGPFSYLADLVSLKDEFPGVKLIADFRDPWTNNRTAFGYQDLNEGRFDFELKQELKVVRGFDAIVSVAQPMTEYFEGLSNSESTTMFHTVPNGFDPEDYYDLAELNLNPDVGVLHVALVGTVYGSAKKGLLALAEVLNETSHNVKFTFCGDMNEDAKALLSKSEKVEIKGIASGAEARAIVKSADVCLLMLTDDLTYSFSTKFCEYVFLKKPIWVVSNDGDTPNFITKNGIGFHSIPTKAAVKSGLEKVLAEYHLVKYEGFDSTSFRLDHITQKYLNIIRNIES